MAFPNAGDHVIGSPMTSAAVDEVRQATISFFEEVLQLQAVEKIEPAIALN